jgi:hypothetical protein
VTADPAKPALDVTELLRVLDDYAMVRAGDGYDYIGTHTAADARDCIRALLAERERLLREREQILDALACAPDSVSACQRIRDLLSRLQPGGGA